VKNFHSGNKLLRVTFIFSRERGSIYLKKIKHTENHLFTNIFGSIENISLVGLLPMYNSTEVSLLHL